MALISLPPCWLIGGTAKSIGLQDGPGPFTSGGRLSLRLTKEGLLGFTGYEALRSATRPTMFEIGVILYRLALEPVLNRNSGRSTIRAFNVGAGITTRRSTP